MGWWQRRQQRALNEQMELDLQTQVLQAQAELLQEAGRGTQQRTEGITVDTRYIDPDDALRDPQTGEYWDRVGMDQNDLSRMGISTQQDLTRIQSQCRYLAMTNEFAINGHENRISYLVGTGHVYTVSSREGHEVDQEQLKPVQEVIDDFLDINGWHHRQQEIVRRRDRDGECFLRFFNGSEGKVKIRFVEPDEVARPRDNQDAHANFGVLTDPKDVETVQGYYIEGEGLVEADQIQHRKAHVDANVKRGVPLFYPVRENLHRAEKLLRNMATVATFQSAISMIRKHGGSSAGVLDFIKSNANVTVTNTTTGSTDYYRRYRAGTILDAVQGMDYEFPSHAIDASRFVLVLQAELRAIASRLVMPEFMLTSDASNANYASTMVAEGPCVKMFERLQWDMINDDLAVMERVLDAAAGAGRISEEVRNAVEVTAEPPRLTVRDREKEVRADVELVDAGAMSVHTLQIRHDLDPAGENERMANEKENREPYHGLGFGEKPDQKGGQEEEPEEEV